MAFALIHRWQKFHMTPRYGPKMIKMCRQNMDAYDVLIQTEPGGG